MPRIAAVATVVIVAFAARTAAADDRADYVTRALAAVRALGADGRTALDTDLYQASRTRCHGDTATPTTACLIDAVIVRCGDNADCRAAADIVITNMRSTSFFVDDITRARLVRSSSDYHAALAAELRRRYAALAAELALEPAASSLGPAIDAMCQRRDRAVHACAPNDTACIPSVPWSRCVAAVVWFVGGTP